MTPRLEDLQPAALNVVYFLWSLAPLVTAFNAVKLGFETMGAQGDPQKLGELKEKGKNLVIAVLFIFGSWLVVSAVINLLGIRDANACFADGSVSPISFQFVFPVACPVKP